MAKPTNGNAYQNGEQLSQSYNSNTPFYGQMAKEGRPFQIGDYTPETYTNSASLIAQVSTITMGTFAAGNYAVTFEIGVNGLPITVSVATISGDNIAAVQARLLAALEANQFLNGLAFASVAATITCTQKNKGLLFGFNASVAGGGAGYSVAETTPPADPSIIKVGRLVVCTPADQQAWNAARPSSGNHVPPARLPSSVADLDYLVGIVLESEFHGQGFFGSPHAGPEIQPLMAFPVGARGQFGFKPVTNVSGSSILHCYISGVNQGRLRAGADGLLTAPLSAAATARQIMIRKAIAAEQVSYLEIK